MTEDGSEWMTVPEVAVRFGVVDGTVRGGVLRGLLPAERRREPGASGAPRVWVRTADAEAFGRWYYRGGPRPAWLDEPSGI